MIKKSKSFTLVELLTVISIIGILATATIVIFSGAKKKARDSRRISDLRTIQTAVEMYYDRNNTYEISYCMNYPSCTDTEGTGWNDGSNGWFNHEGGGYTRSIASGLESWGFFAKAPIDPSGNTTCNADRGHAYMYYTDGSKYSIYAKLEKTENEDEDGYDGSSSPGTDVNPRCGVGGRSCGMNYRIGTGY